jgi:hypothetical protein
MMPWWQMLGACPIDNNEVDDRARSGALCKAARVLVVYMLFCVLSLVPLLFAAWLGSFTSKHLSHDRQLIKPSLAFVLLPHALIAIDCHRSVCRMLTLELSFDNPLPYPKLRLQTCVTWSSKSSSRPQRTN